MWKTWNSGLSSSRNKTRPEDQLLSRLLHRLRWYQDGHVWLLTSNVTRPFLHMSLNVLALLFCQDTEGTRENLLTSQQSNTVCAALLNLGFCIPGKVDERTWQVPP